MTISTCALCGRQGDIRLSHLVPKFVLKWIKRTSATWRLASAADGARRLQDGAKTHLLCGGCEERFSRHEKYFAEKIFHPFHDDGARSFEYDESLGVFAASLSWRALKVSRGEAARDLPPILAAAVDEAEAAWRSLLLGERRSMEPYESHLIFVDDESSCGEFYPDKWYTFRGTDCTLGKSVDRALAYTLLPRMIVVTSIRPATMDGWLGTSIKAAGKITTSQRVHDHPFWKFVSDRALNGLTLTPGPSAEEGERRLMRALERDPSRVLESDTMKIIMDDEDKIMVAKMKGKNMSEVVIWLVEHVIIKSKSAYESGSAKDKTADWNTRAIARVIADLPQDDAARLGREIAGAVNGARDSRAHMEVLVKTGRIWAAFAVDHNAAKKTLQEWIRDKVECLRRQPGGLETPIAVFSTNVEGSKCSFESGFALGGGRAPEGAGGGR